MDNLQSLFPSDRLAALRELIEKLPAFRPLLKDLIQILIVVDASKIQGELRWRLGSRRDPAARSGFHETIESGLFVAVAPVDLRAEIEEHLDEIAADEGVTVEQARTEWEKIQRPLYFYQPRCSSLPEGNVIDPDDLPYKFVSQELGIPVYSPDHHFRAMKVPVISICLDLTARNYARAASVTIGTRVSSAVTITFALEAVVAFCRIVKGLFSLFLRLPKGLQFAIAGLLAGLLIHPKSRARLISGTRAMYTKAAERKPELLSGFAQLIEEFGAASATVERTQEEIRFALPTPRRRSALMYARAILLTSKKPLSITELENRIRTEGYRSQARDFKGYLRRVLRKSGQFFEATPGLWSLNVTSSTTR